MSRDSAKPDETRAIGTPAAPPSSAHAETAAFDSSAFNSRAESTSSPGSGSAGFAGGGSPVDAPELPEVFGRYRVVRLLGRGGMGSVYLAHDEQLDRPVALKVPRLASDPSGKLKTRFLREARAVAVLSHPNICPVFDAGQVEGVHFLAMAYIQGRPLSQYLESGKPQPERGVALSVYKIALALEEAHSKGILHRDLKPANVMVDSRGEPIVMDFGLSQRVNSDAESRLTQEGTVLGTPAYMAPEQIDSRNPIGRATDVYSLGVVLYELLTGRCPFEGSMVSVIGQILHSPPPAIADFRSDISPALAALCERAMDKDPAKRFASMKEFAAALAGFLKGKTTTTVIAPVPKAAANPPSPLANLNNLESLLTSTEMAAGALALPSKAGTRAAASVPLVWIVVPAAAMLAVLALLAFVFWPSSEDPLAVVANAIPSGPGSNAAAPPVPTAVVPQAIATPPIGSPPSPPPISRILPEPVHTAPSTASDEKASPGASQEDTPAGEPAAAEPPISSPDEEADADDSAAALTSKSKPETPEKPERPGAEPGSKNPPQPRSKEDPELGFPLNEQGPPPPPGDLGSGSLQGKFAAADKNHDGKLDPTEVPLHVILRADKNSDRLVDLNELERARAKLKEKLFGPPTPAELRRLPRQRPNGPPGPGPGFGPGGPR